MQIARNSKDSVWNIDELPNVIKIEVEVREASERDDENKRGPKITPRIGSFQIS